jgi:hypothetical protein
MSNYITYQQYAERQQKSALTMLGKRGRGGVGHNVDEIVHSIVMNKPPGLSNGVASAVYHTSWAAGYPLFVHTKQNAQYLAGRQYASGTLMDVAGLNYVIASASIDLRNNVASDNAKNDANVFKNFIPKTPQELVEDWKFTGITQTFGEGNLHYSSRTQAIARYVSGRVRMVNIFSTAPRVADRLFLTVLDAPAPADIKRPEGGVGAAVSRSNQRMVMVRGASHSSLDQFPTITCDVRGPDPSNNLTSRRRERDFSKESLVSARIYNVSACSFEYDIDENGNVSRRYGDNDAQNRQAVVSQQVFDACTFGEVIPVGVVVDTEGRAPITQCSLEERWFTRSATLARDGITVDLGHRPM